MDSKIMLRVEEVTLYRRGYRFLGGMRFSKHHFVFTQSSPIEGQRPFEIWGCYPMIDRVDFYRGSVMLSAEESLELKKPESFGALLSNTFGLLNNSEADNHLKNGGESENESSRNKSRGANIRIQMRDFTFIALEFKNILRAQEVFEMLMKLTCIEKVKDLYAFSYEPAKIEQEYNGWDLYHVRREFERQGLNLEESKWRLTDLNKDYSLCDSYPRKLIIPNNVTDSMLRHAVRYRSRNRFPTLSYYHKANGCTITRCAQPLVGIKQNRSIQDEMLVKEIFNSNGKQDAKNLIVDARPVTNATAQMALGAGSEHVEYYGPQCRKLYLNIDNIHVMRDSLNKFKDLLKDSDIDVSISNNIDEDMVSKTGWLEHIRGILKGVEMLTKWITLEGVHILIHCSDGWDRTAQISSLVQICIDPYYRTIDGICVLIEKEWCSFGHRFNDRCGHLQLDSKFYNHTESGNFQRFRALNQRFQHHQGVKSESPVFQQFMDCIFQLMSQHPTKFEFNERFLRRLVYHLYSCQYGTFIGNCEKERIKLGVYDHTKSVWNYFLCRKDQFYNAEYAEYLDVLDISYSKASIKLWTLLAQMGPVLEKGKTS